MRIILDTNLWISYLISNRFLKLDELILKDQITILFSEELFEEFIEVAKRPKFKKYFSEKDLDNLLLVFNAYAALVNIKSDVQLCRDPKDNFLLNLAIDGEADFLITGDNDLLIIKNLEKTEILTYREFENRLK